VPRPPRATRLALSVAAVVASATTTGLPSAAAAAPATPVAGTAGTTGTLVFIQGYDVWIARPDGSDRRRLTTDGSFASPYVSPSMADDGTVVVGHANEIVRMQQGGAVLNRMDPPPLLASGAVPVDGTPEPAVSPDGRTIAYTLTAYGCGEGLGCGVRYATGYTAADRLTDPSSGPATSFRAPSWVGSTRTLQSGGSGFEVMVHDLGRAPVHWFDSGSGEPGLSDAELSPDGRRLAATGDLGQAGVLAFDVSGDARSGPPPAAPTLSCVWSDQSAPVTAPTWAPDGRALAVQSTDGVSVIGDLDQGCESTTARLVLPGASAPDWSPAAYAPAAPPEPLGTFAVAKKPRLAGQVRVGHRLRVRAPRVDPAPAATTYQWRRDGKALRKATGASYRPGRKDRGHRLSVLVTLTRPGFVPEVFTVRVGKVRR
jgi:hypothetical protein